MTTERARELIMTVLDNEHTPAELQELEALAAQSAEIREEWARFTRVKEATRTMAWPEPPPETWDRYWRNVFNRGERTFAWLLILAGGLVAAGWWLWIVTPELLRHWFADESLPMAVRIAVVVAGVGGIMLVLSIAREQFTTWRKERYRGVIR